MAYKRLFIFVEGDDDLRFFENVIQPTLKDNYDLIDLIKYAHLKPKKVSTYVTSIISMNTSNYFADYIFVADINSKPCISARKQGLQRQYHNLEADKIRVVIAEIESWYLAGLDNVSCKKLKIQSVRTTDSTTKERFEGLMEGKFDSRRDFMVEVLKYFSIDVAKEKNSSFRYFADKHSY